MFLSRSHILKVPKDVRLSTTYFFYYENLKQKGILRNCVKIIHQLLTLKTL